MIADDYDAAAALSVSETQTEELTSDDRYNLKMWLRFIDERARNAAQRNTWLVHASSTLSPGVLRSLRARGFACECSKDSVTISWERRDAPRPDPRLASLEEAVLRLSAMMETVWYAPGMPGADAAAAEFRDALGPGGAGT